MKDSTPDSTPCAYAFVPYVLQDGSRLDGVACDEQILNPWFDKGIFMLVKKFKFKRNHYKGGLPWTAESEIDRPGFYRSFHAVGKTLADVKEFAALVRLCERTGKLERLSEMHPPGFEKRMQTTWGGNL